MSLPAGAFFTSIGGKRCTAIPRAAAAANASANFPATSAAAATAAAAATSSAAAIVAVSNLSTVPAAIESSSSNAAVAAAAEQPPVSQSASTSVELPASTPSVASIPPPSTSNPDTALALVPTTASTTDRAVAPPQTVSSPPTSTPSPTESPNHTSSASAAAPQTDLSVTQTPTSQSVYSNHAVLSTIGYTSPTQAGERPAQSSATAAANVSSDSKVNVGAVIGGIMGGAALIGILFFIWRRCTKRRRSRDSLLTPLNGSFDRRGEKYEIDGDSLGPTPLGKRWKAQIGGYCSRIRMDIVDLGSSVKAKLRRESNVPSIDMNRGNSQFLEPIQQHSRSTSTVSGGHETALTTRDRLADWWQRLTEDVNFNWRLRQKANDPIDHFTATCSMSEKEAERNQISPNFSRFLAMKDHELRRATERHRRSQSTASLPQLESLGLEFNGAFDSFADPFPNAQPTIPNISTPPGAMNSNPFADPISKSNSSDYISSVRRSRGLSESIPKSSGPATRLPSNAGFKSTYASRHPSISAPSSRYPSTIRTSRDTYRDTVLSALSVSGRTAKGRSDPFDLDRPDILQLPPPIPSQSQADNMRNSKAVVTQPRIESVHVGKPRVVSKTETYASSKYSSGVSAMLSEWGDPGPDLGPIAWRRPGPEEGSIGSNEATRGSVSSGQGSEIITVGRAL